MAVGGQLFLPALPAPLSPESSPSSVSTPRSLTPGTPRRSSASSAAGSRRPSPQEPHRERSRSPERIQSGELYTETKEFVYNEHYTEAREWNSEAIFVCDATTEVLLANALRELGLKHPRWQTPAAETNLHNAMEDELCKLIDTKIAFATTQRSTITSGFTTERTRIPTYCALPGTNKVTHQLFRRTHARWLFSSSHHSEPRWTFEM